MITSKLLSGDRKLKKAITLPVTWVLHSVVNVRYLSWLSSTAGLLGWEGQIYVKVGETKSGGGMASYIFTFSLG